MSSNTLTHKEMTITHKQTTSYSINLQILEGNRELYNKAIIKGNSKKDSGFDLYVPTTTVIPPGGIKLINMGVKCAVSKKEWNHTYSLWTVPVSSPYYMYARSSVSKRGIILANSVGIIDSGYRGPLMAAFYNTSTEPVEIAAGERIVQICMPDLSYNFTVNCVDDLDETERGEGGLGSTGK